MADAGSSPSAVAPVSPQYTLLRVKRKRDDNPVVSLILAGETEHLPSSNKRSALTDIRTLLSRARLADDEKDSNAATEDSSDTTGRPTDGQTARRAPLRRVFKLVGTVAHAAASPDDALLSRIAAMQTARQSKAVHPSIAPASSVSRLMEAQQQRAAAARTEKLKEARATTSAVSSASASPASAASAFAFLDVSITKHFAAASATSAVSDRLVTGTALQSAAERPVVAETAAQQHRDHLFSRAMSIVKAMPEKEKMAAYASLLDDYWQATTGSTESQQPSFTQQLQQTTTQTAAEPQPEPKPRLLAGERIDLSSLAPNAQRLYAGAATSGPHHVISTEDESQYVYDVYRVEADGDTDEGEVASVVVDSRVAGWFGLVLDDDDVQDSDEDDEDENREGWEGNDYPEEEDSEGSEADERGREDEQERMVAGDEDEEFYRLRQELKRSKNELIAMSDEEAEEDEGDEDEEEDEDDYVHSHRHYRAGHYDNEI